VPTTIFCCGTETFEKLRKFLKWRQFSNCPVTGHSPSQSPAPVMPLLEDVNSRTWPRFNARMTPISASIAGPPRDTSNSASIVGLPFGRCGPMQQVTSGRLFGQAWNCSQCEPSEGYPLDTLICSKRLKDPIVTVTRPASVQAKAEPAARVPTTIQMPHAVIPMEIRYARAVSIPPP